MQRLSGGRELIDEGADPALLAGTLRDLARINRLLGGADLSWRAVEACRAPGQSSPMHLLDVGTGAADIPRELLRRADARGLPLAITATDISPEVIGFARERSHDTPRLAIELAPPGALPYASGSFDVAHASLVLHHLEPVEATALLAEMARLARHAVVVNDLVRARRWWLAALLLTRIATRNRYTRHDAPLSVRRAYAPDEIADLGRAAGLRPVKLLRGRFGHRFAIVLRPA